MGDKFVGKGRGVGLDFDKIDGHSGDFGEHGSAEGVGEGEIGVFKGEVSAVIEGLDISVREIGVYKVCSCLSDCDSRPNVLESVHGVVVHLDLDPLRIDQTSRGHRMDSELAWKMSSYSKPCYSVVILKSGSER